MVNDHTLPQEDSFFITHFYLTIQSLTNVSI
jgi:hypothetical protein